jgi:UrcA family protein
VTLLHTISFAVLAGAAFAAPAAASSEGVQVSYAGLDLTTPAGIAALDARLERAVRYVCGAPFPADLQTQSQVRRCRASTLASFQAQRGDALAAAQSRAVQLAARGR